MRLPHEAAQGRPLHVRVSKADERVREEHVPIKRKRNDSLRNVASVSAQNKINPDTLQHTVACRFSPKTSGRMDDGHSLLAAKAQQDKRVMKLLSYLAGTEIKLGQPGKEKSKDRVMELA